MNRWPGRVQFATERVAGSVLSVVGLGMRVSRSANVLKIRFHYWRFVRRQGAGRGCAAGAEEKDGDESRENG
jgi:hypothetical protein